MSKLLPKDREILITYVLKNKCQTYQNIHLHRKTNIKGKKIH